MANEFVWLTVEDVVAIHDDQIERYGGLTGLKSIALLESAVAAPLNHNLYGGEDRCLQLAAHLAYAIAKNHAFVDGNKRTATVAMLEFLFVNSLWIEMEDNAQRQPLAELVEQLTADKLTVAQFSEVLVPYLRQV